MALQSREVELLSAWKAISSGAEPDGWRTIPLGSDQRIRVGIRFPERKETFVVSFDYPSSSIASIPQGRGFEVEQLPSENEGGNQSWVSVSRRSGASLELFTVMNGDLVGMLEQAAATMSERQRYFLFLGRIRSWQRFMEKPSDGRLTDEEETGLFGELLVLEGMLRKLEPMLALEIWKGPENSLQDFRSDTVGVEVKTTVSVNGFPAKISSLEQLDGSGTRMIYLAGIRLIVIDGGRTLSALINTVRAALVSHIAAAARFERLLLLAGYLDAVADTYVRPFQMQSNRLFSVEVGFPFISRSEVPLAILEAEYRIDLDEVDIVSETIDAIPALFGSEAE